MPASIGVNLRVTGHCRQGGRKYMEDFFSVAYQQTEDEKDLEYAFFGIYDGHGGGEAATFAKEHLMESIVRQKNFWSDRDEDVLKAIKEGYIATHYAMWKEQEKWPKTASGLPSTAGTTASVAFIRRGKIYIGHVGDSGIILGYQEPGNTCWQARPLTKDHKPENESEMSRIEQCGGKVVTKSGVPRVVWNRPRIGHKGPVRRSTPIDEIPFLAVARSLGDLWSYNSALNEFVVSPDPDTTVIPIDTETFRCLIFGTDGLWNMISASVAVSIVQSAEQHNEKTVLADNPRSKVWINPSKSLVERALERWSSTKLRADNTSVVTLMLDPPGPPRAQVIKNQNRLVSEETNATGTSTAGGRDASSVDADATGAEDPREEYPANGLQIVTRYDNEELGNHTVAAEKESGATKYTEEYLNKIHKELYGSLTEVVDSTGNECDNNASPLKEPAAVAAAGQSTSRAPVETIQINEVSSSSEKDFGAEDEPERPARRDAVRTRGRSSRTATHPKIAREEAAPAAPCTRCTRSHDVPARKSLPASVDIGKAVSKRATSESPKRKTRSETARKPPAKREHNESDEENEDTSRLMFSEPPQKLKRSRSLGPRDFLARIKSEKKIALVTSMSERNLRERNVITATEKKMITRLSLVPAASSKAARQSASAMSKKLNKSFTPTRTAMQTRNRVKRLNK